MLQKQERNKLIVNALGLPITCERYPNIFQWVSQDQTSFERAAQELLQAKHMPEYLKAIEQLLQEAKNKKE